MVLSEGGMGGGGRERDIVLLGGWRLFIFWLYVWEE